MKRDFLMMMMVAAAVAGGIVSCTTPGAGGGALARPAYSPPAPAADAAAAAAPRRELAPQERAGLATGWGREKNSAVTGVGFARASSKPAGTDTIYYNDSAGIDSMASRPVRVSGMQPAAGGLVEWGVKGSTGMLPTYKEGGWGRRLVAGRPNGSYSIVVKNRSRSRLEIVASVDGLDVFDGKPAAFAKRGYLVEPGDTLEIDGFRTSWNTVAGFKFSSVSNSYANMRHGDTRNVGVIGLAVFTQKGVDPWTTQEAGRRFGARAFAEAP